MKKIVALFFFMSFSCVFAECIDLRNIEFQKVDYSKFLASKDGKNIAFLSVSVAIPDSKISFRFFSEKL